jgi:hemerythrin
MEAKTLTIPIWDITLSVGNAKLDEQHAQLLMLAQRTVEFLESNTFTFPQFSDALKELVAFAGNHFETEEQLLAMNACPSIDMHASQHHASFKMLSGLLERLDELVADKPGFKQLIAEWLNKHLHETDIPGKEFLFEGDITTVRLNESPKRPTP